MDEIVLSCPSKRLAESCIKRLIERDGRTIIKVEEHDSHGYMKCIYYGTIIDHYGIHQVTGYYAMYQVPFVSTKIVIKS